MDVFTGAAWLRRAWCSALVVAVVIDVVLAHSELDSISDDVALTTDVKLPYPSEYGAQCHTGWLGTLEPWRVVASDKVSVWEFVNGVSGKHTAESPCPALLSQLQAAKQQRSNQQLKTLSVVVETVDTTGHYVAVRREAGERWLIHDNEALPMHPPQPDNDGHKNLVRQTDEAAQKQNMLVEHLDLALYMLCQGIMAPSALGVLEGIMRRRGFPTLAPSSELRLAAQSKVVHLLPVRKYEAAVPDWSSLQKDVLARVLQLEDDVMQYVSRALEPYDLTDEVSAARTLSSERWEKLRAATSSDERGILATAWLEMANIWLAGSGDITASTSCVARALAWMPTSVAAFLHTAEILAHLDGPQASCPVMEVMLTRVDTDAMHAGELRALLTTHFSHCSLVIRLAGFWEDHTLVRYAVGVTTLVSALRVLAFMGSWLNGPLFHVVGVDASLVPIATRASPTRKSTLYRHASSQAA